MTLSISTLIVMCLCVRLYLQYSEISEPRKVSLRDFGQIVVVEVTTHTHKMEFRSHTFIFIQNYS